MSDGTDTATSGGDDAAAELPGDGLREGIVDALRADLGEHLLDTHLVPQTDLWVRVSPEAWQLTARALQAQGFEYFCFLSAIDWMPSPYGKGEDDPDAEAEEPDTEIRQGYAGGDTRFQLFARLTDIRRHVGVTIKADVPDTMTMPSWVGLFAGANWHERETHEMFGIGFEGHPDLRNIYLPGEFEGHPLRKDFPLLARMIKPWPGIVDVEPMPEAAEERADEPVPALDETAAGDAVEAATAPTTDAASAGEPVDESASATTETVPREAGAPTDAPGDSTEVEPTSDVAEAEEAVEAAHATVDARDDGHDGADAADGAGGGPDRSADDVEPAAADASETARAETADAADAAADRVDETDDGTVAADTGPGTTTESTDADPAAPTPGRATEEHPDGLTGGETDEERDA